MTIAERRNKIRGSFVLGYAVLALGLIVAIWMIDQEGNSRAARDTVIERTLDIEAKKRLEDSEEQIRALQRMNRIQNQILRALLAAERDHPDLFNGANLPRLSGLLYRSEQTGGRTGGENPTGSSPTGGGSTATGTSGSSTSTSTPLPSSTKQPVLPALPAHAQAPARPAPPARPAGSQKRP